MKRNFEAIKLDDEDDEVRIVFTSKRETTPKLLTHSSTEASSSSKDVPETLSTSGQTRILPPPPSSSGILLMKTTTATAPVPSYPSAVGMRSSLVPFSAINNFAPATQSLAYRQLSPKIPGLSHIPSIRMGPPYTSGARNIVPYMPSTTAKFMPSTKFMPKASKPMIFRNRFFNLESQSQAYIPTVNLLDVESSDSPSSANSSEAEDDSASVSSNTNEAPDTIQSKKSTEASKVSQPGLKTDPKSAMRTSASSKVIEPIVIESDDEEDSRPSTPSYSPLNSPERNEPQSKRKAKLGTPVKTNPVVSSDVAGPSSALPTPCPPQNIENKVHNDTQGALQELFPKENDPVEDEELSKLLQNGLNMIEPLELMKQIKETPEHEKPKRLNIKGLYSQSKHGNIGKVLSFLHGGTNPCGIVKNEEGKTPLHIAAGKGHLEILLLLLYKAGKGKINIQDHHNRTPLYMAIDKNQMKVAEFLVKSGANIFCLTTEGTNLLHVASRRGNLLAVKWLIKLGVPINQQDNFGWTALMWCAESDNNSLIIRYLVKQGALTNLLDNEMNICLHWSAIAGSFECARELTFGSSDPQINAKNKFGETPLHVAAKGDHYNVVQYLLINGADPNIKNKQNCTPLDVCPSDSKTFHGMRIRTEVGQAKSKPYMYLSDISLGKEKIPVSCINEVDDEKFPQDFIYVVHPEESKNVSVKRGFSTVNPCKCVGSCTSECKCAKLSEKGKLWYSEDGLLDITLFEEESPVLYECTPLCSCWSYCPNRVAQKGIQYPLQIFKTKTKGWGLRTLTPITQGSFILSYIGELITDEEAERREDTYLFNLDLKTSGDEPNCMDALRIGNCGRFINHSCDANMKAVKLFTHHRDVSFPEVAFFAFTDIQGKEELCFNYGDTFWDVKNENGQYCKCMAENCQYQRP